MRLKPSKYVREGKRTFKFYNLSGGTYGSSVSYDYGFFDGDTFVGMHYGQSHSTTIEGDDNERDGIGNMTTERKLSTVFGSFLGGKRHGFCYTVVQGEIDEIGFYDNGRELSVDEVVDTVYRSITPTASRYVFITPYGGVIYEGETLFYQGGITDEGTPRGFGAYFDDDGEVTKYGYFCENGEELKFHYNEWESMDVDEVEEDGFSVLRKMSYFESGNISYSVTEGNFVSGKLSGLGLYYRESDSNGYRSNAERLGIFKDGELFFGLSSRYESGGKGKYSFGYSDERDISEYGDEITYNGMRYIGEAKDGVPEGIGCLFESEERMIKGTFLGGKPHGIAVTYKLRNGKWIPFNYEREIADYEFFYGSVTLYAEGERMADMTLLEFYEKYESVKQV
ncbi:MAG: hypothetical protein IKD45_04520 [Clostridia bacterium]|nr:hypothetical protein [Clostridia bacterium]